jgi:UDP-2-acetamido-2-deoxy-ribo-hexuluronate aminotransferase
MKQIPMLNLKREYVFMKKAIDAAVRRCMDHQRWISGPEIERLEKVVADFLGVAFCIGVSSGTDALVLALRALATQKKGKEYFDREDIIITTPFTFTATGDAILRSGATPCFVDIDPHTYNLDPARVRECLSHLSSSTSQSLSAVGIIPVHLYGQSCPMDAIMELARQHDLFILEDTAQAFGASWKNKKLGSMGTAGALSFFPSKNLGCFGDGGMVTTNDEGLAYLVRVLLKHGGRDKYNVKHLGYNARLDTIQAAILLAKYPHVDEMNSRRRDVANNYYRLLDGIEGISLPKILPDSLHVFHQFTLSVAEGRRDTLRDYLKNRGVETAVYYPVPLHQMALFKEQKALLGTALTEAERASRSVLSLPIGPFQSDAETLFVAGQVRAFFKHVPLSHVLD